MEICANGTVISVPTGWNRKSGALTICMENPVIPERIQMERFIPVECFRKKR